MITGENDHKKEFRVKPALRPGVDIEREHQAEYPDDHERRIENKLPQPTFTANPANFLRGTNGAFLMIDEETRSEEHTAELKSLMRTSYAAFCWQKKKK